MASKKHVNNTESTRNPRLLPLPEGLSLDEIMEKVRSEVRKSSVPDGQVAPDAGPMSEERTDEVKRASGRKLEQDSTLGLAEIMRRLHGELERRRHAANPVGQRRQAQDARSAYAGKLPRWISSAVRLNKPEYVLHELLQYSDADFVDTAYITLLRRQADPAEREHFLAALRSGQLDKVEILGQIRFSEEGRRQSVHVDGLLLPYKLHQWRRLRGIGSVLAFAMAIVRLPRMVMHLQMLDNAVAMHSQNHGRLINRIDDALETHFSEIDREFGSVRAELLRTTEVRTAALESVSSKINSLQMIATVLGDELHAYQERDGAREHMLNELLQAQARAVKEIANELQIHKERYHAREQTVIERLEVQARATKEIGDELQRHRAELQVCRAEGERSAEAITKLIKAQVAAVSEVERELHAYQVDRAVYEGGLQQRLSTHEASISRLNDELQAYKLEQGQQKHASLRWMDAQDRAKASLEGEVTRNSHSIRDIERRLMLFSDRVAKMTSGTDLRFLADDSQEAGTARNESYVSFEERFRGEREDIKARAAPYVEALSAAGIEPATGVVLDLGCGRGEWLELLAEHGYQCRGVDLNDAMLKESRASGFDVVEADALDYLRGLEDGSLAAITSMHLVEHLPHGVIIKLLDEAMRVLQPGGMLILETPNPENLTVGACWFYLDPTHRNPIPPDLLQWTVQERGFHQAAVRRLTEYRRVSGIQPVSENVPGAEQINLMATWFTAAPDYAVIARKP